MVYDTKAIKLALRRNRAAEAAACLVNRTVSLREGIGGVMERVGRPPSAARSIRPRTVDLVRTGARWFDSALGGIARGHVHFLRSSSADVRTAMLVDLVVSWLKTDNVPMPLAGPREPDFYVEVLLAQGSGLPRRAIVERRLDHRGWVALISSAGDAAGLDARVVGRVHDLDDLLLQRRASDALDAVGGFAVDLEQLDVDELRAWRDLARAWGLPVVIGTDRTDTTSGANVPTLDLARLGVGGHLIRHRLVGASLDGRLSRPLIVDVDTENYRVRTFDPANERVTGECVDDATLVPCPEDDGI